MGDITAEYYQTFETPLVAILKLSNSRKGGDTLVLYRFLPTPLRLIQNDDTRGGLNKNDRHAHIFE